jgi:predicted phage tail protein
MSLCTSWAECDDKLRKKSKNSSTCWVYEQYNKIVESQKFPDVAQTMADLIRSANEEVEEYDSLIKQAQDKLQQVAEERKAAQAAAQAKKKAAGKKNKKEEPKEEAQAEEVKSRATPLLVQSSTNQEVSDDEEYDLFLADQFQKALTHKFVRPFTIGPITFKELQMTFDYEVQRKVVVSELEKTPSMKENNIFVHGLKVTVKDRNLKRGTSLLKHARFLQNLQITPILPPPISPPAEHLSQHSEEMANE